MEASVYQAVLDPEREVATAVEIGKGDIYAIDQGGTLIGRGGMEKLKYNRMTTSSLLLHN